MKELTERQNEIYEFLVEHYRENGYPPTIREIGFRFGIRSTKGVVDHLTALERKGYIRRGLGKSRALELIHIDREEDANLVPLVGRVAAGQPILAEENIEEKIVVDPSFRKGGDEFLLRVNGDSMIEAHIDDGDWILVRPASEARNGEIVVALIGEEATVKRFYRKGNRIELRPENRTMQPIAVDPSSEEFRIVGKVVGLFRRF
ncbi:MAG: transcriptional repressor LexA [Candidatus Eisenbacteria bacterium]|nr:transcriptional repressor LexA [Candidatus Eisenbacteria bacterium]